MAAALPPKILNMTVPQVGQRPFMALRPFFITSSTASAISFLALHLTQYPSAIIGCLAKRAMRSGIHRTTLRAQAESRQRLKRRPFLRVSCSQSTTSAYNAPACAACSLSVRFRILPVAFRGKAGMQTTFFGTL